MRAAPPASHRPLQRGRKVQSTTGRAWRGAECSRQRSRGSGSGLGTRAAQFSEVPGALRMPSCKSSPGHCPALPADLRSANPASFLHLEVARMQEADARGAVWAFVPPPQLFAPRNQITLRAGNLVLLQASLISWEQVIGKEQVQASQACYLIRSTLIADNFRPPGASKRKREELTPRGCSSRSTQLQKAPRDRAKLVPFTFWDD